MQIPSVSLDAVRTSAPARIVDLRHTQVPERPHIGATIEQAQILFIGSNPIAFRLRNSTAHFDTAQSSTCARRAIRSPFGYIGFYDPAKKRGGEFFAVGDQRAERRLKVKKSAKGARRSVRYSRLNSPSVFSRL